MQHDDKWRDNARCLGFDTNIFFDKYEEDEALRLAVDKMCSECPVRRMCLATGVSNKEWGVWGGVYLENGKISKEFNSHRAKTDWANTWKALTND